MAMAIADGMAIAAIPVAPGMSLTASGCARNLHQLTPLVMKTSTG